MLITTSNYFEINNNDIQSSSYTPKACGKCGEPPADCLCPEGFLDD